MTLAQICWSCSSEMHKLLDKVVSIWAMQHLCLCRLVFSLVTDVLFRSFSGIQETLQRLTAMIRGIGDPLVAVYARAYLCRVWSIILSDYILYFSRFSLKLWLFCYKVVFHALSWCIVDDKTSKNPVVSNWRSDPNHIIETLALYLSLRWGWRWLRIWRTVSIRISSTCWPHSVRFMVKVCRNSWCCSG